MTFPTRVLLRGCTVALLCGSVLSAQSTAPNKRKLGPEINTDDYREAGPLVSADGTTLYFLREDQGQELGRKMNAQAAGALDDFEKAIASVDPAARGQMEGALREMRKTAAKPITSLNLTHQTIWVSRRLELRGSALCWQLHKVVVEGVPPTNPNHAR
ncbi:MAG: hypothetical protein H0T71_08635 [Acidobacteria bacterium]|nr:hypothetical protein [Acidobacteriota bacterium]